MGFLSLDQWLLGWGGVIGGRSFKRVLGVLVDEGNEVIERAVTIVVDKFAGASLLELDGRETGDAERSRWGNVVVRSLHLGTEKACIVSRCPELSNRLKNIHREPILEAGEMFTQRVPYGLEAFAVTAPRAREPQGQSC
jgi:hypothetical protein